MANQIQVTVLAINKKIANPSYSDTFPSDSKFSADTFPGTAAASRIDYMQGGVQMSAFVAETITALATLANA